jgi:cystathionine beta-synthase
MKDIYDNILETIGGTPIVQLNQVTKDSPHKFFAKVECFNPGGSVKDRIAMAIIGEAEKRGDLKPGGTIIEATSGNTGLGLALVSAVKGYRCIFVMPDKISEEKRAILRAYGARVVITQSGVEPEDPRSYLSVAQRLVKETPNCFYANQYHNPDNVNLHYQTTGPEIWKQMNGNIDVFVAGAGTGGTISGCGRFLKEKNPNIKIVCADPVGSILYDLFYHKKVITPAAPYKVEGVGEDMLPENTHLNVMDDFEQVSDEESFKMTRRLIAEEALCVGPSSAMALVGAMKYAKKLEKPSRILVVFPDNGRAYLSKAFNDTWMQENGFMKAGDQSKVFNRVMSSVDLYKENGWSF